MPIQLRAKGLGGTSQSRNVLLFKTFRHFQGYMEAVVTATDVSIGPWMVNNINSMCVLPVLTLSTACSFYLPTNTTWVKADRTFAAPCIYRVKSDGNWLFLNLILFRMPFSDLP